MLARPPRLARLPWPIAAACLLAALRLAPASAEPPLSSVSELNAGKARAETALRADRTACNQLAGNARDTCREQARGKEMVAKAELDLAHTGTPKAQDKVASVRLGTTYDLARTRCNDKSGSAKIACARRAQAVRTQGQADLNNKPPSADDIGAAKADKL